MGLHWDEDGNDQFSYSATVAKDFDTFWVGIASNPIQVVPKSYLSSSPKSSDVISQLDVEVRSRYLCS